VRQLCHESDWHQAGDFLRGRRQASVAGADRPILHLFGKSCTCLETPFPLLILSPSCQAAQACSMMCALRLLRCSPEEPRSKCAAAKLVFLHLLHTEQPDRVPCNRQLHKPTCSTQ
jgi:hypothetical protein